jgi:hypothetical protein
MRVLLLLLAFAVAPLVQGVAQERRGSDLSWSAESRGHRGPEAQRGDKKCKKDDRGDARRVSGDDDDHRPDGRHARRDDDERRSGDRDARRVRHGDDDDDDDDDDRGQGRKLGHKRCQEEPPPPPPEEPPPPPPPAEGTAWIAGTVTNDVFGWPGLEGWTVTISGTVNASAVTDVSGNFSFTALPAGTYLVCEVIPAGWIQTMPMSGEACPTGVGYSFTLGDGGSAGGVAFSNLAF